MVDRPWHKDRHWDPPDFEARRRVVAAACRAASGHIVVSARHWDHCMHHQRLALEKAYDKIYWADHVQGFIDQFGFFMDREEAYEVAARQNQIVNPGAALAGNRLCSECLY